MRLVVLLLIWLSVPAHALAQDGPVLVATYVDAALGEHAGAFARGVGRALADRGHVDRALDDLRCHPSDAGCVDELRRTTGAGTVVVARMTWQRGPCVPMRNEAGEIVGHRMLRTPVLELERYDASGAVARSSTTPIDDGEDVALLAERAMAALVAD